MNPYWGGSNISDAIYYNMIISSSAAQRRISFLEIGYHVPTFLWYLIEHPALNVR